ncbi:PP2C family protein-serine/threonine phosphatase [Nocardioides mesophilus]|uniref:Serine/threonine-protein phosphatase n=1 Tax=Nocardioides mesophilus TaxID=433659 RepID=A0A7G9RF26_9ACTN|nr:PP2C family protein-serine/threonine phosphatase [Nocardioides mesophilus]QNN54201.1 serine/threonine-protein phosphatase [Nocardioides mesophilus]
MATRGWSRLSDLTAPLVVLAVIVTVDVVLGPDVVISGAYAIAAVLAGAITTVRRTAVVAGLSIALSAVSGLWNQNFTTLDFEIRLLLTLTLSALAIVSATIRTRRERALRHMTVIAETAQRALLRGMPEAVGSVGFAARYVSATQEALVGGDLYEVAASPFGVRVVVGDVRGKGLDAVLMAGTVLGGFRRSAFSRPTLTAVARDMDEVVRAVAGEEDFVTAVLAEFHEDHTVTLVNCGHHPPLLVTTTRDGILVDTGEPEPPLGLAPRPAAVTWPWPEGSRILLYTDGLVEARNGRGAFFPLVDHAAALQKGSLHEALDGLLRQVIDHAGRRVNDDLALVLVEHRA